MPTSRSKNANDPLADVAATAQRGAETDAAGDSVSPRPPVRAPFPYRAGVPTDLAVRAAVVIVAGLVGCTVLLW
jgi:hypothetical protein